MTQLLRRITARKGKAYAQKLLVHIGQSAFHCDRRHCFLSLLHFFTLTYFTAIFNNINLFIARKSTYVIKTVLNLFFKQPWKVLNSLKFQMSRCVRILLYVKYVNLDHWNESRFCVCIHKTVSFHLWSVGNVLR